MFGYTVNVFLVLQGAVKIYFVKVLFCSKSSMNKKYKGF